MSYLRYRMTIGAPVDGSLVPEKPRDLQTREKPKPSPSDKPILRVQRND